MAEKSPILITGAGGQVGAVSPLIIQNLRHRGYPIRAFVRKDDARAQAMRDLGAEIFVGDLLNSYDVFEAVKGCRRVYFSMSLSPYYTSAAILLAAALKKQGGTELLLDMSQQLVAHLEIDQIRLDKTVPPPADATDRHGSAAVEWSVQERAHWTTERALEWSGLPVKHAQAAIFVENPIYSRFIAADLDRGELPLPLGQQMIALITAQDSADACANILAEPAAHPKTGFVLTGPRALDGNELAEEYSAGLNRPIRYVPYELDDWNKKYIDPYLSITGRHTNEHLKHLNWLASTGQYNVATGELEQVIGRPGQTVTEAIEQRPEIFHTYGASFTAARPGRTSVETPQGAF